MTTVRSSAVVASVATISGGPVVPSDRLAEDLRIDSMERLELAADLEERLGRPVPDAVVMKARTVADLIEALDPR